MPGTLLVLRSLDRLVMSGTFLTLLFSIGLWRLRLERLHVVQSTVWSEEAVQWQRLKGCRKELRTP